MYTTETEDDSKTLRNDDNLKSFLKDTVKGNRDRICIYLNVNQSSTNVVTTIEGIFKAFQKYMTKQPSIGNIGAAKTTSTTLNHPSFTNNVNAIYLDKGNPHILMTEITMKTFNTGISDPLDPSGTTMLTKEYHT